MGGRRKRPEPRPKPRPRRKPPGGFRPHPASLLAWVILLAGGAALFRAIYRETRAEVARGGEPAGATPAPATAAERRRPATPRPSVARPSPTPTAAATPGRSPTPAPAAGRDARPAPAATPRPAPVDLLAAAGRPVAAMRQRPRIAIIIDDVGGDLKAIERATHIPYRLTFSVIPHLRHSRQSAEIANARGYQVMLHLPMEPLDYPRDDPGAGAVTADMLLEDVRRVVLRDLAAIPHVRGVNNHMGSRITADPRRMRAVLEAVATTPYFFVDSRTTSASVAFAIARELKVPSAERAVFLDDDEDARAVRGQFRRLIELARKQGSAIAIGHPHPATLDVLSEQLPELERSGIDVVFASELVS